jgi:hypothetical protein
MSYTLRLTAICVLAFVAGFALAKAEEPLVLPDSDTSSLGSESRPDQTPFLVRCMDAAEFKGFIGKVNSIGTIVGEDLYDKSVIMVFKTKQNSLIFARSDKTGENVCIFGTATVDNYSVDIGAIIKDNSDDAREIEQ